MSRPTDGRTALVVLVPEAEAAVGPLRAKHDPSAAQGVSAHVTVLVPFVPQHAWTPDVEDADGAELTPHRWVEMREGDDWETVDPSDGGRSAWRLAFLVWDFVESTSWPDGVRATSQLDLSGVVVRYAIE